MKKLFAHLMAVLFVSCGFAFGQGLNDGLVAYYPFNGNTNDESGNENHFSSQGQPEYLGGVSGQAIKFDGLDDMLSRERLHSDNGFTWSGWFKIPDTGSELTLLQQASTSVQYSPALRIKEDGIIDFYTYTNWFHSVSSDRPNVSTQWTHIAAVVSLDGSKKLFVDGELSGENISPKSFGEQLPNLIMGRTWSSSGPFHSYEVDELRIYNRPISEDEVAALYGIPNFQIIEGNFTWQEAKADAEAKGGHLATVTSSQEMSQLSQFLRNYEDESGIRPSPWIGGFEAGSPLEWRWVTGEPFSYENWYVGLTTVNPPGDDEIYLTYGSGGWEFYPINRNGSRLPNYILEIIPQNPAPPLVQLGALYESPTGESITIDATPTAGFPTEFTYQWCFNEFKIPANLGGTASSINIDNLQANEGTWSVTVTNERGSVEQSFEYRIYADTDSDGLSDAYEELVSLTDINNSDTDNDGLADGDEVNTYSTNPNSPDSDSDGFTDLYELETAYDPNSAESTPDAQVNIMTAIEVDFNAALGATYEIQFSTDTIEWTVIEAGIVGEGNAVERLYSRKDFPTGFFRVERTDQ
ncbi:hypothetical protein N9H09_02950 [bacterium]|nr:hypothetical protein [bacterium]